MKDVKAMLADVKAAKKTGSLDSSCDGYCNDCNEGISEG